MKNNLFNFVPFADDGYYIKNFHLWNDADASTIANHSGWLQKCQKIILILDNIVCKMWTVKHLSMAKCLQMIFFWYTISSRPFKNRIKTNNLLHSMNEWFFPWKPDLLCFKVINVASLSKIHAPKFLWQKIWLLKRNKNIIIDAVN